MTSWYNLLQEAMAAESAPESGRSARYATKSSSFLTGKEFCLLPLKWLGLGNSDHEVRLYSNGVVVKTNSINDTHFPDQNVSGSLIYL